jgi:alginate O-acetyltransferase complex protein AlgI
LLFNSPEYLLFLPLLMGIYWLSDNRRFQNALLLVGSYVFYGWWDWRFLGLIFLSSLVDYSIGLGFSRALTKTQRKALLALSLVVNLGMLGFFKYYNFFVGELSELLFSLGLGMNFSTLSIILPVGISFYTFQTLSYTIDVYKNRIEHCRDPIAFFAFVSFFPQLVAGPIERANNLVPQFLRERKFELDEGIKGLKQILWGLFKKVVIADSCAGHVDSIFANSDQLPGSVLLLGAIYFAFQIYGDFSGYSDIAIGSARLFGFRLMRNFAYPYFARDIAEFWRKWHISLSTWFRDYVYIPLGGSRVSRSIAIRNIFVIFLVSGIWHGANWTFLVWGGLNALYFLPLFLFGQNRNNAGEFEARWIPKAREWIQIPSTFLLTCLAWIFFRADSMRHAFDILGGIFSSSVISSPGNPNLSLTPLFLIIPFHLFEWLVKHREISLEGLRVPRLLRWCIYYLLIYLILEFSEQQVSFIYFQF